MKIAKRMFVLLIGVLLVAACAHQPNTAGKLISYKNDCVPVSVEEAAPLPKLANIKEIVYFDFDKREVREDSLPIIDKVAGLMKENPDTVLLLAGHTDKYGSDAYNMVLSKDRAETVKSLLVSKGVPADKIQTEWFGKGDLISKINKENRRVLILSVE